jgi:hypothetical protein
VNTENPGGVAVHVIEHNRMVGTRHRRHYVVVGSDQRRIGIWQCEANGWRACQGHGERRPTTLREQPCKRAGHPASERRVNQNGHSFCTACQRDGYRVRKAA